jgi:hypothetical protein
MRHRSRLLLALIAAICALVLVPVAAGADSQGGDDQPLLRSGLVGSTPTALGGPTIGLVPSAGAPWVVDNGRVRVSRDGKLEVRIEGLVLTATGANPIPLVNAKLICNGVVAATTGDADLSPTGDGRIEATVTVPTPCLAPAVLVTISGRSAYIAANG